MAVLTASDIRNAVLSAFPVEPVPGANEVVYDNSGVYDDCSEARDTLGGRKWSEVPFSVLRDDPARLFLLSPRGYAYYVAGFMLSVIDSVVDSGDILHALLFSLASIDQRTPESKLNQARLAALTHRQIETIRSFFRWARTTHPDYIDEYDYVEVDRALDPFAGGRKTSKSG